MSVKSQQANMKAIYGLVSQDLGYIYGERESGPNGAKKQFHAKSAAFLRALGNDLGLKEFKVSKNYGGIALSGEITLMGIWDEGNGLYFQINQPIQPFDSFLYRSTKNMNDYSGGSNQWMDIELFESVDYEAVLNMLLTLRKSALVTAEPVAETAIPTTTEARPVISHVA